jgi:hypothetical protein
MYNGIQVVTGWGVKLSPKKKRSSACLDGGMVVVVEVGDIGFLGQKIN